MPSTQASRQDAHSLLTAAASAILGLALNLVAARALGPAGKGVLDLAGASAGLFTLILGFSLNAGITQHVSAAGHSPAGLSRSIWLWSLLAGLGVGFGLSIMTTQASNIGLLPSENTTFWAIFIAVCTAFGLAAGALRGVVIGSGALVAANRIDLSIKLMLLGGYTIASLVLARSTGVYFAMAALPAIALLPVLLHVAQRGPVRPEPGALRSILLSTLPLHGANVIHFLNQRADLFFVQAYHGPAEVGLYALAVSLAQTVLFLSSALAIPLLPQIAAATNPREAEEAAAAACRRFVLLGGSGAVVLAAAAFWVVPAVFGRAFSTSLAPLFLLLPGMIAFGLTNLLISYFAGTKQNKVNLRVSILGLILTLAGNLTLTRSLGAPGAALVSSLTYGGMAAASLYLFTRSTGVSVRRVLTPDRATVSSAIQMLAQIRP